MGIKELLEKWDAENPDTQITLNTQTIYAALGDPQVMAWWTLPGDAELLTDTTNALVERFGGERDRTVNFRDVAVFIDVHLKLHPDLKQAIKDSLLSLG